MADQPLSFRVVAPPRRALVAPKAIVAIPVKDEEVRLLECLKALAAQRDAPDFATIVLLHNCLDRTEQVAIQAGETLPLPLRILSIELASDKAGASWARRHVMDAAASLFVTSGLPKGIILTTEADARPAPNWVAANVADIALGADAVAGRVEMDANQSLPKGLWRRYQGAHRYARLLNEVDHLIDGEHGSPWPTHREASSASLAVSVDAYVKAGGIPTSASAAASGLLGALTRTGHSVRHDPDVQVAASWRLDPAGIGGQFRAWSEGQVAFDTLGLEPVAQVVRRARLRRTMRRAFGAGQLWTVTNWASTLRISPVDAFKLAALPSFPQMWAVLENISPLLTPHPLAPSQLTLETARAVGLLAEMRIRSGVRRLLGRKEPDA
ncbi:glycosyltransferase [Azorhizobium caulinodans]|nr:glycosyltransferase [Azorhizobium caulinodans]